MITNTVTENMSVRLSQELKEEVDQLADHMDRSRNWIINAAVEQYLEVHRWQIEHIKNRLSQAQSDNAVFIDNDTVMDRLEKRIAAKQK